MRNPSPNKRTNKNNPKDTFVPKKKIVIPKIEPGQKQIVPATVPRLLLQRRESNPSIDAHLWTAVKRSIDFDEHVSKNVTHETKDFEGSVLYRYVLPKSVVRCTDFKQVIIGSSRLTPVAHKLSDTQWILPELDINVKTVRTLDSVFGFERQVILTFFPIQIIKGIFGRYNKEYLESWYLENPVDIVYKAEQDLDLTSDIVATHFGTDPHEINFIHGPGTSLIRAFLVEGTPDDQVLTRLLKKFETVEPVFEEIDQPESKNSNP